MGSGRDATITQLIDRWVHGDREAAAEIYRRYHERARQFALKLTRRPVDADDIAQEALIAGLEGIRGGTRPDHFTGWILGIVKHGAQRHWLDRKREHLNNLDRSRASPAAGPRTQLIADEMDRILKRVMDGLGPDDRAMLKGRMQERLRREELAERLGVSVSAIDRRLEQVYGSLRQALSRHVTTQVLSPPPGDSAPISLEAVAALRPAFLRSFELRHLKGLSLAQTARTLKLPVKTVQARLQTAYDLLGCSARDDFSALREQYRERGL
jgi:RNA polymerase sigma-70 factor (ECF subfamily)